MGIGKASRGGGDRFREPVLWKLLLCAWQFSRGSPGALENGLQQTARVCVFRGHPVQPDRSLPETAAVVSAWQPGCLLRLGQDCSEHM